MHRWIIVHNWWLGNMFAEIWMLEDIFSVFDCDVTFVQVCQPRQEYQEQAQDQWGSQGRLAARVPRGNRSVGLKLWPVKLGLLKFLTCFDMLRNPCNWKLCYVPLTLCLRGWCGIISLFLWRAQPCLHMFTFVRLKASLAGKGGPKKKKKRKTRRNENGKIWSYYR